MKKTLTISFFLFFTLLACHFSAFGQCIPGGPLAVGSGLTVTADQCRDGGVSSWNNNKTLTIQNPAELTLEGMPITLANNSNIVVDAGATLRVMSPFTANNGLTITNNGTLEFADFTVNNSFTFTNNGTATFGNVAMNNNGVISVGGTGNLTINGDLSAGTNTSLTIDGNTTINGDVNIGGGTTTINSGGQFTVTGTYSGPDINGDGTVTLPVDLTLFTTECSELGYTIVNWVTESELNSDYFLLERSRDGINWLSVNEMNGAGNSVHTNHYEYHDLQSGRYFDGYYRLSQFDYNGDFEVFPIISVSCNENFKKSSLELFPNPNKGVFNAIVYWDDNFSEKGSLQVLNSLGKVLYEEEILLEPGTTLHPINLFGTKAGLYNVIVKSSSQILHQTKVSIN